MMAIRHGISRFGRGLGSAGLVLAMLAGSAQAGPIFFPGERREGKFVREGAEKPAEGKTPDAKAPAAKAPEVRSPAGGPTDAKAAVSRPQAAASQPKEARETHCLYTVR